MKPIHHWTFLIVVLFSPLDALNVQAQGDVTPADEIRRRPAAGLDFGTELFIGGMGGVYFLAEPGELVVEVLKRDRHQFDRRTELRAILAGPDRRVLREATIPEDGRPRGSGLGPVQRCRLSTVVERKGVYALSITVSQDRYGEEMISCFRSNCPRFLIETARGHKDEPHREPIVLANPDRPGDVCFLPCQGTFRIDLSDLPKGSEPPQVFDASGKLVATLLTVPEHGGCSCLRHRRR